MSMLPYNIMPQTISPKQSYLNKEEHNEAAIKLITHIAKKKKTHTYKFGIYNKLHRNYLEI